MRRLVDGPSIAIDPGEVAEHPLAFDRHYGDFATPLAVRIRADLEDRLFARRPLEERIDFGVPLQVLTVHFEQILAFFDIRAGLRQRRPQARVPAFAPVNLHDPVPAVFDFEIGPQQSAFARLALGHVATEHVDVLQAQTGEQLVDEVRQVVATAEAVEIDLVFLPLAVQVVAVEVRIVEEVSLDPLDFAVDLPPFGLGIDEDLEIIQFERRRRA